MKLNSVLAPTSVLVLLLIMLSAPTALADDDVVPFVAIDRVGAAVERMFERVDLLIEGARLQARPDEVAHELLAQVVDVDLRRAGGLGLLADADELLLLAEVGGEGHDLRAVALLEVLEDDGGVEASGVGENVGGHGWVSSPPPRGRGLS